MRVAVPGDLDALLRLNREFCAVDGHPFDERRIRVALEQLLRHDELGVVWVADDAASPDPAGYAVVTWGYSLESGGREALLDELYVRDRGVGTGRALMGAVLAGCRAQHALVLFLETEASNERARRFYEQLGFARDDSIWMSRPVDRR